MYILQKIKNQISSDINNIFDQNIITAGDLITPPNPELGDLGISLFKISNLLQTTPNEISKKILENFTNNEFIKSAQITGPYLNFFLQPAYLAKNVIKETLKDEDDYGQSKKLKKEKILLEFSNANTHKEYHVGHLRNICYGDAVTKILQKNGHQAVPISYINDFGIHVAKTIWWTYSEQNSQELKKQKLNSNTSAKGFFLGKMYREAVQAEQDSPVAKQMIAGIMQEIESRQGKYYKLWEQTRDWSINYFNKIYKDLDITFKHTFYESAHLEQGRKLVEKLLKKGVLRKSEGAVIADLEQYNLGVLVFIRSNGTTAYPVADLGLVAAKAKLKPSKSIYIVDNRQSLYFKQLFKVLELVGHKEELIHLAHDFVKLPSGMMSSRSGNTVVYDDLQKLLIEKITDEILKRHHDWGQAQVANTAKIISLGAIKFEMLKIDANKPITFDIDQALSFEGFTAAYIQYTYARINSIFAKNAKTNNKVSKGKLIAGKLSNKYELALIKKVAEFPEIVQVAGAKFDPSELARYSYELAKLFNEYYHKVSIINSEEELKNSRLILLSTVAQTIKNSLALLGIETVKQM